MNHFQNFPSLNTNNLISPLQTEWLEAAGIHADVLRLDLLHPYISGNKWFKLKFLLEDAIKNKCTHIVTFGGVWSNHIHATAAACKLFGLSAKAFIRGEEMLKTATLSDAIENGMEIAYCSRAEYSEWKHREGKFGEQYFIPEGGLSRLGIEGASTMLNGVDREKYDCIFCAVGTGTSFAGLVNMALPQQQIIGINALKGGSFQLETLRPFLQNSNFEIWNDFHFGGFAKTNPVLFQFMNDWYDTTAIPTDIIYTAKMFYAVQENIRLHKIKRGTRILLIHSGGLQGNRSLDKETLQF